MTRDDFYAKKLLALQYDAYVIAFEIMQFLLFNALFALT